MLLEHENQDALEQELEEELNVGVDFEQDSELDMLGFVQIICDIINIL
jgi:hypothetical protein